MPRYPPSDQPGFEIREGGLDHPDVHALLRLHRTSLAQLSPAEAVHALDASGLAAAGVRFWAAWQHGTLLGCAALKPLDAASAELKSMRTSPAHLRRGVARRLLEQVVAEAYGQGFRRLYLETGIAPPFAAAHALYAASNFVDCAPFADYLPGPHSRFMVRELGERGHCASAAGGDPDIADAQQVVAPQQP